jgi:hypothetical protein
LLRVFVLVGAIVGIVVAGVAALGEPEDRVVVPRVRQCRPGDLTTECLERGGEVEAGTAMNINWLFILILLASALGRERVCFPGETFSNCSYSAVEIMKIKTSLC